MGRKPKFDRSRILRAVGAEESCNGARFGSKSSRKLQGASIGSLYHRFETREALLAEAWLRRPRSVPAGISGGPPWHHR
jgi:AcrR family transcriptional regulator